MAYINLTEFKALSLMPASDIDALETAAPGFFDAQLNAASAEVDARLSKRYGTPFASPVAYKVRAWVANIATVAAYLKRGVNPSDEQFQEIKAYADRAFTEMLEAANAELGLFELPLRSDTSTSGVIRGRPQVYSEQSPYVGLDNQARTGITEDRYRGGSYGRR